jgi:hypothetical protein
MNLAIIRLMATLNNEQVVQKIRDKQGAMTLRNYALSLGISVAYLSDIYQGKRDPGPKILKKFNLTKTRVTTVSYAPTRKTA